MKTMFNLIAHTLSHQERNAKLPKLNDDLSINEYSECLGLFSTKKKAEKMIHDWLKHTETWGNCVLGFSLEEKPVDNTGFCGDLNDICTFVKRWSYDCKGNLLCDSPYDNTCMAKFRGRMTQIPFSIGDIVLVEYNCIAHPMILTDLPLTNEVVKAKWSKDWSGDYSDDSCTAIRWHFGHTHPESVQIFPFIGTPIKELEKKLWSEFKQYLKDGEFKLKHMPSNRHELYDGWWKN